MPCLSLVGWCALVPAQEGPNNSTYDPSMSDDGRFIAFGTRASNLLEHPGTSVQSNVYVMDRVTRRIINAGFAGSATYWGGALFPQISGDGEWLVFQSSNSAIPGSVSANIYVCVVAERFRAPAPASKFKRISRNAAGEAGNDTSWYPSISGNGRFIAYMSEATNLTADVVTANMNQVYRHDRDKDEDGIFDELDAGATETILVSKGSNGVGNGASEFPTISRDGRKIIFFSKATNLGGTTLMWHDGAVVPVTARRRGLSPDGNFLATLTHVYSVLNPNGTGSRFRVKADGSAIGFPDNNGGGNRMSNGAAFVAFATNHPAAANDTNGTRDVYLYSAETGKSTLISVGTDGNAANGGSGPVDDNDAWLDITPDGRYLAFATQATNFGFADNNGSLHDTLIYDRLADGVTTPRWDRIEADVTPPTWPNPSVTATQVTYQSVRLTWTPAQDRGGIQHYSVNLGEGLARSYPNTTSVVVEGLKPSTTYTVTLRAQDHTGHESLTGPSTTFTTPAAPASVASLGFRVTGVTVGANISVSFSSVAGKTYRVESSSDLKTWVPLKAGIASQGTYTTSVFPTPAEFPFPAHIRVVEL